MWEDQSDWYKELEECLQLFYSKSVCSHTLYEI